MTHYTTHKLTPELFEQWKQDRKGELISPNGFKVSEYVHVPWMEFPHYVRYTSGDSDEFANSEIFRKFTLRLPVETKEQYAAVYLGNRVKDEIPAISHWCDSFEDIQKWIAYNSGYFTRTIDSSGKVIGDPIWTVNKEEK